MRLAKFQSMGKTQYGNATSRNKTIFFLPTGRVVRADIMTESSGRSKGCGTVLFDAPEDAAHAISIL